MMGPGVAEGWHFHITWPFFCIEFPLFFFAGAKRIIRNVVGHLMAANDNMLRNVNETRLFAGGGVEGLEDLAGQ